MSDFSTRELTQPLSEVWQRLLTPLLVRLDTQLDSRLVGTLSQTVRAIIEHRHRSHGLLLSELGAYLISPSQAPAGTKRLSNLLRSSKWSAHDIAAYLWQHAHQQVTQWHSTGEDVLALWDESVLEKPESQAAQGLSPVRSCKAARLSRIKPGYYRPPAAPVFVPGLHWMALLFIGRSGPPCVAAMQWWGTRSASSGASSGDTSSGDTSSGASSGDTSSGVDEPWLRQRKVVLRELLQQCQSSYGKQLLHLFDRGFAGAPWLQELHQAQVRFVLRWPKAYKLQDKKGEDRAAWHHLRGKRSWEHQMMPMPNGAG